MFVAEDLEVCKVEGSTVAIPLWMVRISISGEEGRRGGEGRGDERRYTGYGGGEGS